MTARGQREAGSLTRMICEGDHGDQNTADCGNKLRSARARERTRLKTCVSSVRLRYSGVYFNLFFCSLFPNVYVLALNRKEAAVKIWIDAVLIQNFISVVICKCFICFYMDV